MPIPYKNCGSSADKFKITRADASIWPPKVGQPLSVTINGTLSEDVSAGTYEMKVKVLGILIMVYIHTFSYYRGHIVPPESYVRCCYC